VAPRNGGIGHAARGGGGGGGVMGRQKRGVSANAHGVAKS